MVILFSALSSKVGASQISVSMSVVIVVVADINVACGGSQGQGAKTRSSFQIRHSTHATGNVLAVFAKPTTFGGSCNRFKSSCIKLQRKTIVF